MALLPREVICTECYSTFEAIPRRSFLGFLKFICPDCKREFLHPLTSGYRTFWWIMIILGIIALFGGPFGVIFVIAGIAGIVALVKDSSLKKKLQLAWLKHSQPKK
jgi:hypothetical protein